MTIKNFYWRWLIEQLTRRDKVIFLGCVIWLKWCEDLRLPMPDLKSPAGWTTPVFFLVGVAGDKYYRLSNWWTDLQIRWLLSAGEGDEPNAGDY